MIPPKAILRSPIVHAILGVFFLLAFSWPIFAFERPINTWVFLYAVWALGIFCIFLSSQASAHAEEDDDELGEEVNHHV
ncbi:MAG: hypothetical protein V3V08_17390 [Nannocystaceae bacterium]